MNKITMCIKCIVITVIINYLTFGTAQLTNRIDDAKYNYTYTGKINRDTVYIYEYFNNQTFNPTRIVTKSLNATNHSPLLVIAHLETRIQSWQIPYAVDSSQNRHEYNTVAHTLCANWNRTLSAQQMYLTSKKTKHSNVIIILKTSSKKEIDFELRAYFQDDFFVHTQHEYETNVSVSLPIYYYYNFHDPISNHNDTKAVLVKWKSRDLDKCMMISIQNSTCPIFDLESNVRYQSFWQTMTKQAGMVVRKYNYPDGFHIVMVMKDNNEECNLSKDEILSRYMDEDSVSFKTVAFTIQPTITMNDHIKIVGFTIGIFGGVFCLCLIVGFIHLAWGIKRGERERTSTFDVVDATNTEEARNTMMGYDKEIGNLRKSAAICTNGHLKYVAECAQQLTERAEAFTLDKYEENESSRWRQLFKKSAASKRTTNYVWHVGIVALFYTLPVIQLVLTYQKIFNDTGNEDLCYYNFLCAHPFGFITDFNHIFSNIGYVILGFLFLVITYVHELLERSVLKETHGLPKPYGMFYALGFALIMEGVMSACYHVCPKSTNFQFDTCFMYVMTVLMIVNIYENRHTHGDSSGYAVFGMLAVATVLSVLGIYLGTEYYFWILFSIIQISFCIGLTWTLEKTLIKNVFRKEARSQMTRIHICRIILWILGNTINWLLAVYGTMARNGFGTYLLMVLIVNALFYTIYYISMKLCYKEKILLVTWIFAVLATIIWSCALYFFISTVTSWELSPAESRNLNEDCKLLGYYDNHDIWHFLSAIALFFTFIVLLTLDEGITDIRRSDIVDFHGF